jgi:hypothetical protein
VKVGAFLAVVCLAAGALAAGEDHLLAGAQLFRERRFQEAYVEFTVAARLGAGGDAAWYAAATLVKLERPEDALVAFAAAERAAPSVADPLLDYYRALACYDARLFLCADRLLEGVGDRTGPRIGAQARKMRADIAALLATEPSADSIDWYHAHGAAARKEGHYSLAALYFTEAAALSHRRQDRHREAEARASLVELRKEVGP